MWKYGFRKESIKVLENLDTKTACQKHINGSKYLGC
jgi:hypothetical protein